MFRALARPEGLVLITALAVLTVLAFVVPVTRWFLVAMALYVGTFGYTGDIGSQLAFPLQEFRTYGRALCAAMLILMMIPTLRSSRGWRMRALPFALVFYSIFQLIVSVRQLIGGDVARGYFGTLCYLLIIGTFGLGLNRWLQTPRDAIAAVWAVVLGGALFIISTAYQWRVNPAEVVEGIRLLGLTGNPQHAATLLGTTLAPACFLMVRSRRGPITKVFLAALLGLNVVMLGWTGSRTGALMGIVALALLFRARVGKFVVTAALCGMFMYIALSFFAEAGISTSAARLLDPKDTRSVGWARMLNDFIESPLIGRSIVAETGSTENSYLLIASRIGLVGLVPFSISILLIAGALIRLQRLRAYLGDQILLADLVTAGVVSLAAGAMFEGFLYATFSFPLFTLFIYVNLLAYLTEYGLVARAEAQTALLSPEAQMLHEPYESQPVGPFSPWVNG